MAQSPRKLTMHIDETHDPVRSSWIESANLADCDFPIQNLPFGVFRRAGTDDAPSIGVAIGDRILDVRAAIEAGAITGLDGTTACALYANTLNDLMKLGRSAWVEARKAIARVLDASCPDLRDATDKHDVCLIYSGDVEMLNPAVIGDYTDFYASRNHATNVGKMFRPDGDPLLPNYRHLPVGYHGRASTVVPSGTPIRRPIGQTKADDADAPTFGPCRLLDYELEMGFFVGPATPLGDRIPIARAAEHLFGMCIVNDWSARDIQKWEYVPLGPFNAKNFATSISPWIVTLDALEPYRVAGPPRQSDDPMMLDYLKPTHDMSLDINVEVHIASKTMRDRGMPAHRVSRANFRDMFWTIAQMLVHHTSTGCAVNPGDLMASGTISGPTEDGRGCLLEMTWRGQNPVSLPDGSERKFLQDGDEVIISAFCEKEGYRRIGFGSCRGIVEPAT
ncbi:MAG: fumarylacetoacetase [Planctomycetota bacterium]